MLPCLGRLRLGDATGVTLDLVERSGGTANDDVETGRKRRQRAPPGARRPPPPRPNVEATVEGLTKISQELRRGGSATRTRWKAAVVETMQRKVEKYEARAEVATAAVEDEHIKINEYIQAAYAKPDDPGVAPLADENATDPWDVVKDVNDRWKTLVAERSVIRVVLAAAEARKGEFEDAEGEEFDELCETLATALDQLVNDYRTMGELLETMRQLFVAFLDDSMSASQYRVNYILMGDPGTGKTRLARLIASVLGAMGIFVFSDIVEVYRSDFVADYEGQTAGKTRRLLGGSIEKVVFLDEAYMLTTWDKQKDPPVATSYSAEATAELLTFLENNVGSTCFIAAGYAKEMQNDFLKANPGLTRRFTQQLWLKSYKADELARIYLDELARSVSTADNPYDREDIRQWFTAGALAYLVQMLDDREAVVADAAGNEVYMYPNLQALFSAQAGAMVTLAAETKLLLASSGKRNQLGENPGSRTFAIGPEDLKKVVESRFLKSFEDAAPAIEELLQVACANGWYSRSRGVWDVVQAEEAGARDCPQDADGKRRGWFSGFGRG